MEVEYIQDSPNPSRPAFSSTQLHLVDLGLGQASNLVCTILDLAVGSLESAQDAGALLDGVVASQLVVRNAVQRAVA
jgi:hypothetical protein